MQVGVNQPKSTKMGATASHSSDVRQVESAVVADHHPFNISAPIEQEAHLARHFGGQFAQGACQLRAYKLPGPYASVVKILDSLELAGFKALGIAKKVFDNSSWVQPVFCARPTGKRSERWAQKRKDGWTLSSIDYHLNMWCTISV